MKTTDTRSHVESIFSQIQCQRSSHLHMIVKPLLFLHFPLLSAHVSLYELIVHNNKTLDASQHRVLANFSSVCESWKSNAAVILGTFQWRICFPDESTNGNWNIISIFGILVLSFFSLFCYVNWSFLRICFVFFCGL